MSSSHITRAGKRVRGMWRGGGGGGGGVTRSVTVSYITRAGTRERGGVGVGRYRQEVSSSHILPVLLRERGCVCVKGGGYTQEDIYYPCW